MGTRCVYMRDTPMSGEGKGAVTWAPMSTLRQAASPNRDNYNSRHAVFPESPLILPSKSVLQALRDACREL